MVNFIKTQLFFPLFFSLFFLTNYTFSQTKIRGSIIDFETGEGIPFASIIFPETTEGCVSDFNGNFFLQSINKQNKIIISCIGYITDTVNIKPDSYNEITINLKPDLYSISEVIVTPGKDPALLLMKKVIRNKKKNSINKLKTYSYEQYTKQEIDINNFDKDIFKNKIFKDFEIAFNGTDTSEATGKIYMPVLITETLSKYFFQKFPKHRKEVITATKISGIENISASQFTGQMYVDLNFYKSYITIIDKEFVSPLSLSGPVTYKYYIIDTSYIDNTLCYHITFKPKRRHEYTFHGDMWITDTTFALKKITAYMSENVNLDFIRSFYVRKDYEKTEKNFFFPAKEEFFIDFNISKVTVGFFGRKYTSRKNIKINPEFPKNFFAPAEFREIEIKKNAGNFTSSDWDKMRHIPLTEKEKNIYSMVDSVKRLPTFKKIENSVYLIGTGYLKRKYIELGPYYKIFSRNALENNRFRIGFRTSNYFSKIIELNGYTAFGTRDLKVKYGIGSKLKINSNYWTLARINYSNDLIQLGANLGDFGSDNIFSVSGKNDKLLHISNFETGIERDVLKSLTATAFFTHKKIMPTDSLRFISRDNIEVNSITASEITVNAHFGINEEYIESIFNRQSFGSLYPIIELSYTYGIPNFLGSDYSYHKLTAGLKHFMTFGFFGKTNYYIEVGKIFGTVPYPLLKLHEGNSGIAYDMRSFNLMNYYEFASDEYISFFGEHHFNGLILNKIPLLRKLKFREVIYAKGVWGSLKDENREILQFPETLSDVKRPYIEIGLGVENIFNFLSINYFRRVTHIHKTGIHKNGIFLGFHVNF